MGTYQELRSGNQSFFGRLITVIKNELPYNPLKKKELMSSPNNVHPTVPKLDIHKQKTMLCIWWDKQGLLHYDYISLNL